MTTKQAFEKLLANTELCERAGIKDGTVRQWKKRINDSTPPTIAVMEAALLKAGAKKIPEKWVLPKKK